MSNNPSAEERKIAVLVAAMQDMHGEIETMFQKMQAVLRLTHAANAEVRQAGAAVVPAVSQATAAAVEASMKLAFVDIGKPARLALEAAVKPATEQFLVLGQRIQELEAIARRAMSWFSVKWIALTAGAFVAMSAMAWAAVGWQRIQVSELTAQRAALETDVAEMQANAAVLAKKGGRIKMTDCGGRLCIVASKNQTGSFSEWHGLWNNNKTGETMVIPNGY